MNFHPLTFLFFIITGQYKTSISVITTSAPFQWSNFSSSHQYQHMQEVTFKTIDPVKTSPTKDFKLKCEEVREVRILRGQRQYLIKWQGFPQNQNSWQNPDRLRECRRQIQQFNSARKIEIQWMERQYLLINSKIQHKYPLRRFELPQEDDPYTRTLKKAAEGIVIGSYLRDVSTPEEEDSQSKYKIRTKVGKKRRKRRFSGSSKKNEKKRKKIQKEEIKILNRNKKQTLKRENMSNDIEKDHIDLINEDLSNSFEIFTQVKINKNLKEDKIPPPPPGYHIVDFKIQIFESSELQDLADFSLKRDNAKIMKDGVEQDRFSVDYHKKKIEFVEQAGQIQRYQNNLFDIDYQLDLINPQFQDGLSVFQGICVRENCQKVENNIDQQYSMSSPFDENGCYKAFARSNKQMNLESNFQLNLQSCLKQDAIVSQYSPLSNQNQLSKHNINFQDQNLERQQFEGPQIQKCLKLQTLKAEGQNSNHLYQISQSRSSLFSDQQVQNEQNKNDPDFVEQDSSQINKILQDDYQSSLNDLKQGQKSLFLKQFNKKHELTKQKFKIQGIQSKQTRSQIFNYCYQPLAIGNTYEQVRKNVDQRTMTWTSMSSGDIPKLVKVLDVIVLDGIQFVYGLFLKERAQLMEKFVMLLHFIQFFPGQLEKYQNQNGVKAINIEIGPCQ